MSDFRDFVHIQPLGTSRRLGLLQRSTLCRPPRGSVLVAEMDNAGHPGAVDSGWMVRLQNNNLVRVTISGAIKMLNQRKAELAIKKMEAEYAKQDGNQED